MKKLFFTLFFLLIISACRQSTINPGGSNAQTNYFPLQVGNEWVYEKTVQDTYRLTIRVVDKRIINKKEYFVVEYSSNINNEVPDYEYLRNESNKIFSYTDSVESLKYDFSGTDSIFNKMYNVTFNVTDTISIGVFDKCISLNNMVFQSGCNIIFAPNIGIVFRACLGGAAIYRNSLIHAKINGKQLF